MNDCVTRKIDRKLGTQFLSPAFSHDVFEGAFLNLFCAPNVSFELLGEKACQLRKLTMYGLEATRASMDTLWRISLVAKNVNLAPQTMNDLLSIYNSTTSSNGTIHVENLSSESIGERFGRRVFDCLSAVKE
jgi:hypothetical protein